MPNNTDTIYTGSGEFDIEYLDSVNRYKFKGECMLIDSTALVFDIVAPITRTTDWKLFKENSK